MSTENGTPETGDLAYVACPFEPLWRLEFSHFSTYYEPLYQDPESPEEVTGIRMVIVPCAPLPDGRVVPVMPAPQITLYFGIEWWRETLLAAVQNDGKVPAPRRPTGIIVAGADDVPGGFGPSLGGQG